jgi:hypothetical protein
MLGQYACYITRGPKATIYSTCTAQICRKLPNIWGNYNIQIYRYISSSMDELRQPYLILEIYHCKFVTTQWILRDICLRADWIPCVLCWLRFSYVHVTMWLSRWIIQWKIIPHSFQNPRIRFHYLHQNGIDKSFMLDSSTRFVNLNCYFLPLLLEFSLDTHVQINKRYAYSLTCAEKIYTSISTCWVSFHWRGKVYIDNLHVSGGKYYLNSPYS